jgi:hypothetical protein
MASHQGPGDVDALAQAREIIAQPAAELQQLRSQLTDQRLARGLKRAFTQAAVAGMTAAPVSHPRLLEMIVVTAAQASMPGPLRSS